MALLEKQLFIKKSSLPGAGKGLFTGKEIPKGSRIVEYTGDISTWKEVDDKGGNMYIYYVNRHHVIDARKHKTVLARYANDAKGPGKVDHITNNSTYEIDGLRVYIVAMKTIRAGSEILAGYGKEYWDIIKENSELKIKEDPRLKKEKSRMLV
jgi:SET domain-containing protein